MIVLPPPPIVSSADSFTATTTIPPLPPPLLTPTPTTINTTTATTTTTTLLSNIANIVRDPIYSAMVTEAFPDELATALCPEVTSSTSSSIYIKWAWEGLQEAYVKGFKVHFKRVSSSYVQFSDMLPANVHSYGINNLVADTYYTVCVSMHRNDTARPVDKCVDAATTSWHIPVSIGSSIGAVLALSIIVLIVLMSRCPTIIRQQRTAAAESSKYDSMSSHFPADDRYEMSDTTTQCHDKDDLYLPTSEISLTDTNSNTRDSPKQSLNSPQSLAERLWNGSRMHNGHASKPGAGSTQRVPLAKCGRAMSLQDRKHQHRNRQMRLAHLHNNFHSIQSEPGTSPRTSSATDFPSSTPEKSGGGGSAHGLSPSPRGTHYSSLPTAACTGFGKPLGGACAGCNQKPAGFRDGPRLLYRIESGTSSSEPVVISKVKREGSKDDTVIINTNNNTTTSSSTSTMNSGAPGGGVGRSGRKPNLKTIGRTFHMSIDGDTRV